MTHDEIIKQLESLLSHCKSMIEKNGGFPIREKDCEALETAIAALHALWDNYNQISIKLRPDCDNSADDKALYTLALSTYGAEAQTLMVFEEMAELQKELCKRGRGKQNRAEIAEEIADVQIMLEQMQVLYGCAELVSEQKRQKLERLEKRLRG